MRNNILVGVSVGYAIALAVLHLNPVFILFPIALLIAAVIEKVKEPVQAYVYDDEYLRDGLRMQRDLINDLQTKVDALNIKSAFKPQR